MIEQRKVSKIKETNALLYISHTVSLPSNWSMEEERTNVCIVLKSVNVFLCAF